MRSWSTRSGAARAFMLRLVGFATNSDGAHVTRPEQENHASRDADWRSTMPASGPAAIGYVNGHGTATEQGDIAETPRHRVGVRLSHADQFAEELSRSHARRVRRARSVVQRRDDERRLVRADAESRQHRSRAAANSTTSSVQAANCRPSTSMSNNFAFGGVNTSLVFRRWSGR